MNLNSKIFNKKKKIPLNVFINECLYNLKHGFYMKQNPIGLKGDFITSPKISILFSEMIAIWCISFWKQMGCPKKINILEIGPGDGTLSLGLIKTFSKFNQFNNSYSLNLLEKSKYLIKIQKKKLICSKVKWISNISNLTNDPVIIIANEFFDALPIKQFIYKNQKWFERYVEIDKLNKIKFLDIETKLPDFKKICKIDIAKNQKFIEFSLPIVNYIKTVSKIINKNNGGLICFDYGYTQNKMFNSLQSVKKHRGSHILSDPGNQDITHLLNFTFLEKLSNQYKLDAEKIITQGKFLKTMGIIERANTLSKSKNFKEKADIYYRLKRLVHPNEMGDLFKVFFLKKKGNKFNLGFI